MPTVRLIFVLLLCSGCYGQDHEDDDHADGETHDYHSRERVRLAISYLGKYGYIVPSRFRGGDQKRMQDELKDGLKRFQYFSSLKTTGVMDDPTTALMKKGRCGVPDPPVELPRRRKRYSIQGSRWAKSLVVWRLATHGRTLTRDQCKEAIIKATELWSKAANMNFREAQGNEHVDMWITFASGYHGDPRAFDGPNGTLGHAFFPVMEDGLSGDIHFDNDEKFVFSTTGGYDIVQAMVHEMGHALGLEHSRVREAIMSPYQQYGKFKANVQLHLDDTRGLQRLYGKPKAKKKAKKIEVVATTTMKPVLKYCPKSYLTAVFFYQRYNLFVAMTDNQLMYFVTKEGQIRSGPKRVTTYYPASLLPGRIDAAYTTKKINPRYTLTVIFVGTSYYLYNGFRYWSGPHSYHSRYEKDGVTKTPLEMVLPDWIRRVDSVFTWSDGDTYVFSGRYFWRFGYDEKRMRRGYPRIISTAWKGLPNRIHAAFMMADGTPALVYKNRLYELEKGRKRVKSRFPIYLGNSRWMQCRRP